MKILGTVKIVVKMLRAKYLLVMNVGIQYVICVLIFAGIVESTSVTVAIMIIKKNVIK